MNKLLREKMLKRIKSTGFHVSTFRAEQIAELAIEAVIEELGFDAKETMVSASKYFHGDNPPVTQSYEMEKFFEGAKFQHSEMIRKIRGDENG